MFLDQGQIIQEGDLVIGYQTPLNMYVVRVKAGDELVLLHGVYPHTAMIGKPYGTRLSSHTGSTIMFCI